MSPYKMFCLSTLGSLVICLTFSAVFIARSDASFEFVFTYLEPQDDEITTSFPYLLITTTSISPVPVTTSVPGISFSDETVVSHERMANISLPTSVYLRGSGKQNKAIIVHSESQISVYAMYIYKYYRSTGFSVLPTNLLAGTYYASSYDPDNGEWSELSVTALGETTLVNIEDVTGTRVDPITLAPYESYQMKNSDDLSGTRIEADKPVSVMSGSSGVHVGHTSGGPEYMIQHIPPVERLGTSYILTPFLYRTSGYYYRVIATERQTRVNISGEVTVMDTTSLPVHRGSADQQTVTTIVSDKPVLVAQFALSHHSDTIGDTFMLIIPPLHPVEKGDISVPVTTLATVSDQRSYIHVTIACKNMHSMTIDGAPINNLEFIRVSLGSAGDTSTTYCVFHRQLEHGTHQIRTPGPNIPYEAIVYGFGEKYVAYGFTLWGIPRPNRPNQLALFKGSSTTCDNSQMVVLLNSSYVELGHSSDVHLLDSTCTGEMYDNNTIRLTANFGGCGTTIEVRETSLVFHNKLIYKAPRNQNSNDSVPRYLDLNINLACNVPRRGNSTFGPLFGPINADQAGFGNFKFSLQMFADPNFSSAYDNDDFPIMIEEGQAVFLAAMVEDVNDLRLSVELCRVTPSKTFDDSIQHSVLEKGCGTDHPVTFYEAPDTSEQRFSIPIYNYFETEPMMFIHCSMIVCSSNDSLLCQKQTCPPRVGRSIDSNVLSRPLRVTVSAPGPLMIRTPNLLKPNDSTRLSKASVTLAVVGGVFLLLAIIIIGAFIMRRAINRSHASYITLAEEFQMDDL